MNRLRWGGKLDDVVDKTRQGPVGFRIGTGRPDDDDDGPDPAKVKAKLLVVCLPWH